MDKKRCVGLLRLSSQEQSKGHGYDRQRDIITHYTNENDYQIEKFFHEEITGTSDLLHRESVVDLLAYCEQEDIHCLIIENAGRFARDKDTAIQGMYALQSKGIESIIFADKGMDLIEQWSKDSLSALIPFLEISFAEKEKKELVEKLARAKKAKRDKGIKVDGRKRYAETGNPKEVELVNRIKQLRRKPKKGKRLSIVKITEQLNAEGYTGRYGGIIHTSTVYNILTQKKVA